MEVLQWRRSKKTSSSGFMVRVNPEEAVALINSLSAQLMSGNPNTGRIEFDTEKGEYFSIGVHRRVKSIEEKEMEIDYIYNKIQQHGKFNATKWPGEH
jgi:hypothetical protein